MLKARFDWDPKKDIENQQKHGVSFANAQYAFADPRRVIAEDVSHSGQEKRYYCFGKVAGGVYCPIHDPLRRDPLNWRRILAER